MSLPHEMDAAAREVDNLFVFGVRRFLLVLFFITFYIRKAWIYFVVTTSVVHNYSATKVATTFQITRLDRSLRDGRFGEMVVEVGGFHFIATTNIFAVTYPK